MIQNSTASTLYEVPLLLAAAVVSGLITGGAAAGVLKASHAAGFLKKERDA